MAIAMAMTEWLGRVRDGRILWGNGEGEGPMLGRAEAEA